MAKEEPRIEEKKEEQPKVTEAFRCEYYADLTRIGLSQRTVVFDFGLITPFRQQELKYEVRILMSPDHFNAFVELVKRFEATYKPPPKEEKK